MMRLTMSRLRDGVRPNTYSWWIVALLVVFGGYLRLASMGDLGFRWDEDLSSLAAKAILESGIPELPSGMIYLRGGLSLYLMAASADLFGFSEWSMRLPAALFGIATIPLAFVFGRMLFSAQVGLLLAGLMTLSAWDIEFARYARMYTPFGFFYLLTLICIWRYRVVEESLRGGILCIALAILSISLHQLGYTLALALLIPLVVKAAQGERWLDPRRLLFSAVAFFSVAGFFFIWRRTLGFFFTRASRLVPEAPADSATAAASEGAGGGLFEFVSTIAAGVLQRASELSPLLGPLWGYSTGVGLGLLIVALSAVGFFCWRQRSPANGLSLSLLSLIGLCCALQLFNLALLVTLALAFFKWEGIRAFRRGDVLFAVGMIGVSFVAWFWIALSADLGGYATQGASFALRETVRDLLDFPKFYVFWGWANQHPWMSVVAAIGALWAFDRAARREPDGAALFLILAFMLAWVVNGLFETRFEQFRYNVPFNPLYFSFVALGLAQWPALLTALRGASHPPQVGRVATAAGTAVLAALVLAVDLSPVRGLLIMQRDYFNPGALYGYYGMTRYTDFKTPAAYVAENASSEDVIIVLDCREYYNYLGRLDYYVRTARFDGQVYDDRGTIRDAYVATPLVMEVERLEQILQEKPGAVKWLIASDEMIADTVAITDELKDFIMGQKDQTVYVGRDGVTKVYRFESG